MNKFNSTLKIFSIPFIVMFYLVKVIIMIFWELIKIILSIFGNMNINNSTNSNIKKTITKDNNYKDVEFNKQADLWGLSKEDRRIAKQERMSPADFIEAEERDDDELITDEWE